jgi:hypothetical protein
MVPRSFPTSCCSAQDSGIESVYLVPVLRTARSVRGLVAHPDAVAFCCSRSIEELEERGDTGALGWIRRFENIRNTDGAPLPVVLARSGHHWYEIGMR